VTTTSLRQPAGRDSLGSVSLVQRAYDEIKARIMNSSWPPGFQASEPHVANVLEMSRTPVREALLRLESEGLVRVIPRRGMYVVPLSADDMREIYGIR
jgi:DNA-binding GntR family transcriptional regulator